MREDLQRFRVVAAPLLLLAGSLGGCSPPSEDLVEHGVVKLQLLPGETADDATFNGTIKVEVSLDYEECLRNFYNANPEYQKGGLEDVEIFGTLADGGEGWKDRLCDQDLSGQVECTVDSFVQELSDSSNYLQVTYSVSGEISFRQVPFGPLPDESLANCEAGLEPQVRVESGAVRGLDGAGNTLWTMTSFNPSSAITGQGAEIQISVARSGS